MAMYSISDSHKASWNFYRKLLKTKYAKNADINNL
jgi:hypothetical protein